MQEITHETAQPQTSINQPVIETQSEPVAPKKSPLIAIMAILLIFVTGVAVYFYLNYKENIQNIAIPTTPVVEQPVITSLEPTTIVTNPTDNWKTYTNIDHNFSFQYPSTWKIENRPSNYGLIAFSIDDDKSFFVTLHQSNSIQKWLDDNQSGKIIGGEIIGEHTFMIVQGGALLNSIEYLLSNKDDEFLRFVVEPSNSVNESEKTFEQVLSTLKITSKTQEETSNLGTIKGKLCYPSNFLPPGEIVAKNIDTKEIINQKFLGSTDNSKYSMELPTGKYNIRYQAHPSKSKPSLFSSGYYTECALDNTYTTCSQPNSHDLLPINVINNTTISDINLCDFGSSELDEELLNESF